MQSLIEDRFVRFFANRKPDAGREEWAGRKLETWPPSDLSYLIAIHPYEVQTTRVHGVRVLHLYVPLERFALTALITKLILQ